MGLMCNAQDGLPDQPQYETFRFLYTRAFNSPYISLILGTPNVTFLAEYPAV
jgi:hypothetical protein